jgi:hypothetical protein
VCFESATGNVGFTTIITKPVTIYRPTRLSYDQLSEHVLKVADNYTTIQVVNQEARLVFSITLQLRGPRFVA